MTTKVEKSILVNVPVSRAYNQGTQFEEFPVHGRDRSVKQLEDDRLEWVAEIAGVASVDGPNSGAGARSEGGLGGDE